VAGPFGEEGFVRSESEVGGDDHADGGQQQHAENEHALGERQIRQEGHGWAALGQMRV
jgi:hypothetical protein